MLYLTIRSHFSAAHHLQEYPGDCSRLHGHNWKLKIIFRVEQLDSLGMGLDFRELKQQVQKTIAHFDHCYLNELPEFKDQNPTAEHIALVLFRILAEMNLPNVKIYEIEVFESDNYSVIYRDETTH